MNSSPTISVIVPAYNASKWISQAIQSALDQTRPPAEVLVIDDGSTDSTADIVSAFRSPVRLIRQSNAGPAAARNLGASQAIGAWLAFLDADDLWQPAKLEKQVEFTNADDVGIVHTLLENGYWSPAPQMVTFERLWDGNCIGTSSVLIRKDAFIQAGGFAVELVPAEDYDLWLRVAAAGWRIVTCSERLTFYRQPPGCLSRDGERLTRSIVACIEKVGRKLNLPDTLIRERLLRAYEACGRSLLYQGRVEPAREWLGRTLRLGPSLPRLFLWLKTFLPVCLLTRVSRRTGNA